MASIKPEFTYLASLARVVDGDTVDLMVDLGFQILHRIRVRIRGMNAPELHTVKHGTKEHEAGKVAAQAVYEWFADKAFVHIRTYQEKGKFGRWLASIESLEGDDLASTMIASGFARATDEDGNEIERRE